MTDNPLHAEKRELRRRIRAARGEIGPERRSDLDATLLAHLAAELRAMDRPPAAVAAYFPVGSEPGGRMLVDVLQGEAERVVLPVSGKNGRLSWGVFRGRARMTPGPLGTQEPPGPYRDTAALLDCAAVIVPALAVDRSGRRLGQGGGYYDRTLAELDELAAREGRRRPRTIAIVYDEDVREVPVEEHDAAVDVVVTDRGTFRTH